MDFILVGTIVQERRGGDQQLKFNGKLTELLELERAVTWQSVKLSTII